MTEQLTIAVVGGGAAGFFGAIACAQAYPQHRVIILEKSNQILTKMRISGGGRCNVTHACFDPSLLVRNYPRGHKALRGPFSRFQPKDTIQWFESRGVPLKVEEDGRMFPVTDQSETIISCLQREAEKAGVAIRLVCGIKTLLKQEKGFKLELTTNEDLFCDRLLMATGSSPKIYPLLEALGHTVVPLVPSLFTFNVPDSPLLDLAGVSVPQARVKIKETELEQTGPLLITHWGFSGPAVLKLSAWGARILHHLDYKATFLINWLPTESEDSIRTKIKALKQEQGGKQTGSESPFLLPKQLWRRLLQLSQIDVDQRWALLSNGQMQALIKQLLESSFSLQGKTTYKQEFVTCGGVNLDEVNFKTMESRLCPGLYFAGEVLDIDGVTGGFNFQNAWTTGWIAGHAMGKVDD